MSSQSDRPLGQRELTRRDLLRGGGLVLVSLGAAPTLLAACGGGEKEEGLETTAASGAGVAGSIDFLSWEGYDLLTVPAMEDWRKQHGVRMSSTYIGAHEDIEAKIVPIIKGGGGPTYDLITYNTTKLGLYEQLEMLTPIDESKVPNIANLYPFFREGETSERFWVRDGVRVGVPWTWGSVVVHYRADKVKLPESVFDLLKPEFKGKVGCVDDPTVYNTAGRALGLPVPNLTQAQFDEVSALLRQIVAQTPGIAPSYGDLTNQLVSGEVVAAFHGWAPVDVWAQEQGADVKSTIPVEGSWSFCDAWAIPPTTDNKETVLAFINESLSPEGQAQSAEALAGGVVTPEAVPLTSKEIAGLYPYEDIDDLFARAPLMPGAPPTTEGGVIGYDQWIAEWGKIKAGQ